MGQPGPRLGAAGVAVVEPDLTDEEIKKKKRWILITLAVILAGEWRPCR